MNIRPQDNTQGNVQLQHEILAGEELRNLHEVVLQHVVLQLNDHLQHMKHEHESLLQSSIAAVQVGGQCCVVVCLSISQAKKATVPQLIEIGLRLVCRSMICTTAYVTDLIRPVNRYNTVSEKQHGSQLCCILYTRSASNQGCGCRLHVH